MWRGIVSEVRRAWTLNTDGMREIASGRTRHHTGAFADPHLLRGYLFSLPIVLLGVVIACAVGGPILLRTHNPLPLLAIAFPFTIVAVLFWFGLAARLRARKGG